MNIQFFKRDDGSSLSYVGDNIHSIVKELGHKTHQKTMNKYIEGDVIKHADVGICFGLIRDMHHLNPYKKKVAGLVCETDLTEKEIGRLKEVDPTEIWVPSQFCIDKFRKAGFRDVYLVPHGIEPAKKITSNSRKNSVLMVFNSYPKNNFHVERKGIFEVLRAFALVNQANIFSKTFNKKYKILKDVKLLLRTRFRSYYKKYDLTNVEFIERRYQDIGELYGQADIVLCPSGGEGFGLVGLEAIVRGIPLISTRTGNDYLEFSKYIHLKTKRNEDDILDALYDGFKNLKDHRYFARKQAIKMQNKYSWERIALPIVRKRLEALFDKSLLI